MDMNNLNKPLGEIKDKKLLIILGLVAVIIIITAVALLSGKKKNNNPVNTEAINGIASNTAPLKNEAAVPGEAAGTTTIAVLQGATVAVPGTNPITKTGQVVTLQGVPVKNDVLPLSPGGPMQTEPIAKDSLPAGVIKLDASASGFNPKEFTVKAGQAVTLSLTSTDDYTHILVFNETSLSAVAIGVMSHQTRAITFNAPAKAGEYAFRCDVFGHAARGETGKMIVE